MKYEPSKGVFMLNWLTSRLKEIESSMITQIKSLASVITNLILKKKEKLDMIFAKNRSNFPFSHGYLEFLS